MKRSDHANASPKSKLAQNRDGTVSDILYSDEAVEKKRVVILNLLTLILEAPRKESYTDLFKLHIDAALDKLDSEVYEPIIQNLLVKSRREGFEAGHEDCRKAGSIFNHEHYKTLKSGVDKP